LGIVLGVLGLAYSSLLGIILGILFILTAAVGVCPAYSVFDVSTVKKEQGKGEYAK
jgi:hypothetical protein